MITSQNKKISFCRSCNQVTINSSGYCSTCENNVTNELEGRETQKRIAIALEELVKEFKELNRTLIERLTR